ncbi:hypothetical protein CIW49_18335 [Mycolicibacterium sp. P1-18]|nr:hypothetical protein CIW49_18335 [Mycolicibacterium sp. P1-18]
MGAPPPLSPPKGPRKADVLDDESWRHDPARSAEWFAPRDPAPERLWHSRRDGAHVRSVDTVVADVETTSTPSRVDAFDGLVKYDLRRIEVAPGKFVQEYTVKVHLRPGTDVDSDAVAHVAAKAHSGVDDLLNQGFRLPSGDQFHVNLEFTDNADGAHTVVHVGPGGTDQTHWNPNATSSVLAHETLHYLGVPDEYDDTRRVFLRHDTNSGVHRNDGGMMGHDVLGADPGLRPRHLWLVERAANSQVSVPDTRLDDHRHPMVRDLDHSHHDGADPSPSRPAPDLKRGRHDDSRENSPDASNVTGPFKRLRTDDSPIGVDSEVDVQMDDARHGSTESLGRPVELPPRDAMTKYNNAFAELADGHGVFAPSIATHLAALNDSVVNDKPIAFVVNAIVSVSDLHRLPAVIDAMTANAEARDGKVAFVIGVNTELTPGAVANLETTMAGMEDVLAGINHPVALTAATWNMPKTEHLPYGTMRNDMMHSGVNQFAIAAMLSKGNHPYLAIQDFDTGSRNVASGKHVFDHVVDGMTTGDGLPPLRPLMFSGGYTAPRSEADFDAMIADAEAKRSAKSAALTQQLSDLKAELVKTTTTSEQWKDLDAKRLKLSGDLSRTEAAQAKLAAAGFREDFTRKIEQDMDARVEQAKTSPLLPYTPEPNLFFDAVATLVDPEVKFGDGGAEFSKLGRSLAHFNAAELAATHDANVAALLSGPMTEDVLAQVENERSHLEVDAQTGRHPVRGVAFMTDFKGAAVETDLARIALGYAADGKLPQSHVALTGVVDRFFATKSDKGGTSLTNFRKEFAERGGADREPTHLHYTPDAPKGTPKIAPAPFTEDQGVRRQLGLAGDSTNDGRHPGKHKLDAALSTPVPGHPDVVVGIDQGNHIAKGVAAVNVAMSSPEASIQRKFASLNNLVAQEFSDGMGSSLYAAPPPAHGGLFHAVGDARGESASSIRQALTSHFAGKVAPKVLTDLANFVTENPTTDGDLVRAIIQPGATPDPNWAGLALDRSVTPHRNDDPDTHPGGGDPTHGPLTNDEPAAIEAQKATNAHTARNAEGLALRALATQLNTNISVRDTTSDTEATYAPFGKAAPKSNAKATVKLDATAQSDGRNTYSPRQPTGPANRTRPAPSPGDAAGPASAAAADTKGQQLLAAQKEEREEREQEVFGTFEELPVVSVRSEDAKALGGSSGVHKHVVDGREVAIKPGRGARAVKTELFAQALYRATGAPTLRATPVRMAGVDSKVHLMSDFLVGNKPDESAHAQFAGHPDVARFAAADMLLSNWDSHKTDAYLATGRRVVRIDVGGSLDVRAQGAIREGWTTTDVADGGFDVDEIKPGSRMRTGGPFQHLTDEQVADSIRTVADRLTPEAIDDAIVESGYPRDEGQELKTVLQTRIAKALEWADLVYPATTLENRSFGTILEAKPLGPLQQLHEDFGYEPTEDLANPSVIDHLRPDPPTALQQLVDDFGYEPTVTAELSLPSEIDDARSTNTTTKVEHSDPTVDVAILSVHDTRVADALGPKPYTFEQKVDARVPAVGPEELLRASQHGDDRARARFAQHSGMLDGGVLIRRMSEAEVEAFHIALASDDLVAIERALFPTPPPGSTWPKRGEIVWSLNDTFTFTRELASGSEATRHDPDGYGKILEIPVTAEMARLLGQNLYISNPVQGAKPAAFRGNPNLKYEGTAGGANDSTGVPNVVIKRNGFAGFWSTVQRARVFDEAAHVSAHQYAPAVETKKERAKREAAERKLAKELDPQKSEEPSQGLFDGDDDFVMFGGMLDDDPPHTPAAPPSSGSTQARPAPEPASPPTIEGLPVAQRVQTASAAANSVDYPPVERSGSARVSTLASGRPGQPLGTPFATAHED